MASGAPRKTGWHTAPRRRAPAPRHKTQKKTKQCRCRAVASWRRWREVATRRCPLPAPRRHESREGRLAWLSGCIVGENMTNGMGRRIAISNPTCDGGRGECGAAQSRGTEQRSVPVRVRQASTGREGAGGGASAGQPHEPAPAPMMSYELAPATVMSSPWG